MRGMVAGLLPLPTSGQFEVVTVLTPEQQGPLSAEAVTALTCVASRGLVMAQGDEVAVAQGVALGSRRRHSQ